MRILVATSSFARYPDDPEAAAGNGLYELFSRLGEHIEGTLVTHSIEGAPDREQLGGIEVRRVGPERPTSSLARSMKGRSAGRVLRAGTALKRAVEQAVPGHHIAHGFWFWPGGWSVSGLPIPKVITVPGGLDTFPQYPVIGSFIRKTVRAADICVAVDPGGTGSLTELGAKDARWIPSPVTLSHFPLTPPGDEGRLVFVGRLSEEKRVDLLLDALDRARVRRPDLTLEIVGDGPEREALQRQARELGLSHVVTFLGAQKRHGVVTALTRARALVLPSRREGLPTVALEALSMGRPVVASAVGGLPGLLEGGFGITVPPGDPVSLSHALIQVLEQSWDQQAMRARVDGFGVEDAAQSYRQIYGALAEKAGAGCSA